MKLLLTFVILMIFPVLPVHGAQHSLFQWDQQVQETGIEVTGPLTWSPQACSFEDSERFRDFPVLTYKGTNGKPIKPTTGSYCFLLQLPRSMPGHTLHFRMIRMFGNAEILINQRRVWHQDASTGLMRPWFLYDVESPQLQVELRLRCSESPSCGFRGKLHIADSRQGTRDDLLHISYDLLAVTGIMACLFYHVIFALLRRRSSIALFLSFNAVALLMRIVLTGQGQLHYFLQLSESSYWRLETLAVLILLPSTISLIRLVFEEETPAFLPTLGWVVSLTASLFLILDARIYFFLLMIIYALVGLNLYIHGLVAIRALRNNRSGSIIFVISALVSLASTVFEILNARLNYEMHAAWQPMSYLATMIFQSVLLATRINDAFSLAETQESEIKNLREQIEIEIRSLDHRIMERTTELRTIFQSISTGILLISRNDQETLVINSEYSEHLRKTIGFDIQSWHEMHFFMRRLKLPGLPSSGKGLAEWFQHKMLHKDSLDASLEEMFGGLRAFDDLDQIKHLKFKWVPIVEADQVTELFLFVFDVSRSIEIQELARHKTLEIEALRELATLAPALIDELGQLFSPPSLPVIRKFSIDRTLPQLEQALIHMQSETHLETFMHAYHRVLLLLAKRLQRQDEPSEFDLDHFLQLPDWQNLPVDSRSLIQSLIKLREKQPDLQLAPHPATQSSYSTDRAKALNKAK